MIQGQLDLHRCILTGAPSINHCIICTIVMQHYNNMFEYYKDNDDSLLVRKFMEGTRERIIIMIETKNVISFFYRLFLYYYITTIISSYLINSIIQNDSIQFKVYI